MSVAVPPTMPLSSRHLEWRRLHPLSPLASLGPVVVSALVALSSGLGSRGGREHDRLIVLALAVIAAVAGLVSWLVTRWRIEGDDLRLEKGLVFRQSLRVPLARVQAVDVIAPLLARVLGLAEVRVVVAGRTHHKTRLAFLGAEEAVRVRAELLALAHGLEAATPEPASWPLFEVVNGRLLGAALLSGVGLLATVVLAGTLSVVAFLPGAAYSVIPTALAAGTAVWRRVVNQYGCRVDEAPDGLRIRRGLLVTRSETIPFGRIQALVVVQPLLWRPFGWCRLDVDVARAGHHADRDEGGGSAANRMLMPVGSRAEALWLLSRVFPAARVEMPDSTRIPRRALLRAPLSRRYLAAWHDSAFVVARCGRVRAATIVLPLEKVQSVRLRQGPWLRRLRLANLHVDTAGRHWQAAALCRDAAEAERWLEEIGALARTARRALTPAAAPQGSGEPSRSFRR